MSHSVPQVQRKIAIHKPNFHILSGNGLEPLFAQVRDKSTNPLKSKSRPDLDTDTPVVIRAANSIDVYANWERSNGSSPCLRDVVAGIAKDFNANPIILLFNRSILFKEAGSIRWNIVGKVSRKGFSHNTRHISRGGEAPFMLYPERVERGAAQQLTDIVDQFGHGGIGKRAMFASEKSPPPKHLVRARGVSEAGGLQTVYLKQDALKSFVGTLKNPAKGHGIHLHIRTGFRSFDFQKKMLKLSPENAETPGFSEHHLGTAVDITGVRRESEAFLYLLRNGEGTGWIPSQYFSPVATVKEPWHWRYVGVSAAEAFYKQWREVIQREIEFLTSLQEAGALCENPNLLKESR